MLVEENFSKTKNKTAEKITGQCFPVKSKVTCKNWAHLDEEKKFGLNSHLRASCTQHLLCQIIAFDCRVVDFVGNTHTEAQLVQLWRRQGKHHQTIGVHEQYYGSMHALYILVYLFAVLCKTEMWNDQIQSFRENVSKWLWKSFPLKLNSGMLSLRIQLLDSLGALIYLVGTFYIYVVVLFYPCFNLCFPLFHTHYCTFLHTKTKENWTKDKI